MNDDAKSLLRSNLRRLLAVPDGESGVQRLIAKGIANGTAQRLLAGQTSVGLDVVDRLAEIFHVPAWRLLAPNLGETVAPTGLDQLSPLESMLVGMLRQAGPAALRAALQRLQGDSRPDPTPAAPAIPFQRRR